MAFGRDDQAERAQAAIVKLRSAIEDDEQKALQFETIAASSEAKLSGIAAEEAAGNLSPEDVDRRLAEVEAEGQRHRLAAAQRRRVNAVREADIAKLERELELIPFEAKVGELEAAVALYAKKAPEFAKALPGVIKLAATLVNYREKTSALRAEAERLRPEGAVLDVAHVEEEWPEGVAALAELLTAGPVAPARKARAAHARATAELKRSDDSVVSAYVAQWGSQLCSEARLRAEIRLEEPLKTRTVAAILAAHQRTLATLSPERRAQVMLRLAERNAGNAGNAEDVEALELVG